MGVQQPVISLAIEPKTRSDQEKLGAGLQKLMAEDPTCRVNTDAQTGQVIIHGTSELHLEIIVTASAVVLVESYGLPAASPSMKRSPVEPTAR